MPHDLIVALIEPEIPGNVGSIGRTCVSTETPLWIVGPLPFQITDTRIKRAGLDYWPHLNWVYLKDKKTFFEQSQSRRLVLTSAHAKTRYCDFKFQKGDILVFGKETLGLKDMLNSEHPSILLPMWGKTRSLNLANSATTILYEAYRQLGFPDYFPD